MPRDRDASFEPQVIPKRTRDVSGIEDKVLSMYARGMSQRDIADTVEDIYGFEIFHDTISAITDRVVETADEWQNRPLKKFYTFLFVDCLYVSVRKEMETKNLAVYVILGYDVNGVKDILGLWVGKRRGNITGCRSSMRSKPAAWRMCCSSAWTGYPAWKKGQGLSLRMPWSSAASCTWSAIPSDTYLLLEFHRYLNLYKSILHPVNHIFIDNDFIREP